MQSQHKPTPPPKDTISIVEDFLPRETNGKAIIDGMQNLSRLIEAHIDDCISISPIPNTDILTVKANVEKALSEYVDNDSRLHVKELSGLLIDARTRKSTVKYLVSWILLSGISYHADPKHILLPSELIVFMNQIPPPTVDWHSKLCVE